MQLIHQYFILVWVNPLPIFYPSKIFLMYSKSSTTYIPIFKDVTNSALLRLYTCSILRIIRPLKLCANMLQTWYHLTLPSYSIKKPVFGDTPFYPWFDVIKLLPEYITIHMEWIKSLVRWWVFKPLLRLSRQVRSK